MPYEPFPITLWIIIVLIIVVTYILSLLLSREKHKPATPQSQDIREAIHLYEENLEHANIELNRDEGIIESSKKSEEVKRESIIDSSNKKSVDGKAVDALQEDGLDNTLEELFREDELDIVIEEDEKLEPGEFMKTAEELRNELYKLRKILEGRG